VAFVAPQGNLPIGVSETPTCLGWGPDMSDIPLWNLEWEPEMPDSEDLTRDKAERPDMSGKPLWNPVSKPDKSG
jgi:hypothetical protein